MREERLGDKVGASEKGRYAGAPSDMPWAGWKQILKRTFSAVSGTTVSLQCAGVAFFTFLSIFPMLACLVLLYGLFTDVSSLQGHLISIKQFVPLAVFELVEERIEALLSQPEVGLGIGLAISFALALWSGSRGTNALVATISSAYREEEERSFIAAAVLSLGLTLGGLLFLIITLLTVAILPAVLAFLPLPTDMESTVLWLRWPLLAVFVTLSLAVLFKIGPDRRSAKWAWVLPGAILATLLWVFLSVLFSIYVEKFGNYGATFGSLSVAVVMMLWLYYSVMIVALGASLNAEIEHQTKVDTTRGPSRPMGDREAYVADNLPK